MLLLHLALRSVSAFYYTRVADAASVASFASRGRRRGGTVASRDARRRRRRGRCWCLLLRSQRLSAVAFAVAVAVVDAHHGHGRYALFTENASA